MGGGGVVGVRGWCGAGEEGCNGIEGWCEWGRSFWGKEILRSMGGWGRMESCRVALESGWRSVVGKVIWKCKR